MSERNFKKIDGLAGKLLINVMEAMNRVYNNRERPGDRQARQRAEENGKQHRAMVATSGKQTHNMAHTLLAATASDQVEKGKWLHCLDKAPQDGGRHHLQERQM